MEGALHHGGHGLYLFWWRAAAFCTFVGARNILFVSAQLPGFVPGPCSLAEHPHALPTHALAAASSASYTSFLGHTSEAAAMPVIPCQTEPHWWLQGLKLGAMAHIDIA